MKKLTSTTIIPKSLYVARDADRQLATVISGMGRPGYVLVARQMGKTNLLINAKRDLESSEDVYAYIDLSGGYYENPRDCFRNIIDIVLEVGGENISVPSEAILKDRERPTSLPAAKEHERELRGVLKNLKGKLVIILDEIDSLTKTNFSDQVFAFIRSIYFSRVSYSEYEKLTYVLSGVAEPANIIKDKSISPFNIGQKIYLDDFNRAEFDAFLFKSGLELDGLIADRIFWWTNGNPRTTWDLCSSIEDALLAGKEATEESVDEAVNQLYFGSFDKEPIDHIRQQVADSKEIRNALTQMAYGKGEELSDAMRSRLYLAGIIGGSYAQGNPVCIKNRIIERALSEKWLSDIERSRKSLLALADDKYDEGDYQAAVDFMQEYLSQHGPAAESISPLTYFRLATAHFMLGNYHDALKAYDKADIDKKKLAQFYYEKVYRRGIACFFVGLSEDSIAAFETYTEEYSDGNFYRQAQLNLSSAYFKCNFEEKRDKIEAINREILDSADAETVDGRELLTFASVNLSRMFGREGNEKEAVNYALEALKTAKNEERPAIFLEALNKCTESDDRDYFLGKAIEAIISGELEVQRFRQENTFQYNHQVLLGILAEAYINSESDYARLWDYSTGGNTGGAIPSDKLEFDVILTLLGKTQFAKAEALLNDSVGNNRISMDQRIAVYKYLWLLTGKEQDTYRNSYISLFESDDSTFKLDETDVDLVLDAISDAITSKSYSRALEHIADVHRHGLSGNLDEGARALVEYMEMVLNSRLGREAEARKIAEHILGKLRSLTKSGSEYVSRETLEIVQKQAADIGRHAIMVPIKRTQKKIGRNEKVRVKYLDGRVIEEKYKRVQGDVEEGKCELLSPIGTE
ncbi:AAA-like domain-containing protein [Thiohalomonas denitrificans]|uniref:AAA-like domain-containing protein n=1 Tax=Thiohalomonas denitrificans TaxID=415747 RepID=UPI0026EB41F6|nr:AAA-like domain-containing protein [Thiohalomonas denitrificans]